MTDAPTAASPGPDPSGTGAAESTHKDRRGGLIVFGILLLLMAVAALGSAALQFVMLLGIGGLSEAGEIDPSVFGYAGGFYLLVAAALAWLGIGSIQCRRWARALLLVLSAMALVSGIVGSIYMVSIIGPMADGIVAEAGEEEAAAVVPFIMGCVLAFVALLYLVLPAAFFLFYRSPHVKATCELNDPTPRWTDRYPAPLLAGGLLLFFYALIFFAPILGTPMPFFGALLTGVPAWAYAMGLGFLAAFLGAAVLRLERWAWLASLAFVAVTGLSTWLSFRGNGLLRMYESMGLPADQVDMMESTGMTRGFSTLILVSLVVLLVFFVWLGRYFGERRTV